MLEPARTLDNRPIASLVLHTVWYVVPNKACTMDPFLVDAHHSVAGFSEERDDVVPPGGVVPAFALRRALHSDANVRFGKRTAIIGERDTRRYLGWVDDKNVARSAVQPDVPEVGRLPYKILVVKEQT